MILIGMKNIGFALFLAALAADQTQADGGEILTAAEPRESDKANMLAALNKSGWRIASEGGAAELLGLKPSTLAYRMQVFGLERMSGVRPG
jgi:transcriptional regulator with GAF, ATPase, and Fis domain